MAENTTTLSSAITTTDTSMVVVSATGATAGGYAKLSGEEVLIQQSYTSGTTIPIIRGQLGTATAAHIAGENVTFFTGTDLTSQAGQTSTQWPIAGRGRVITSYKAAGAITLPPPGSDAVALLVGTVAADMTLADPSKDMDGSIIYLLASGAAAWTVTAASGFGAGGSSYDKLTFAAGAQVAIWAIAANGAWLIPNSPAIAGTVTNLLATIG